MQSWSMGSLSVVAMSRVPDGVAVFESSVTAKASGTPRKDSEEVVSATAACGLANHFIDETAHGDSTACCYHRVSPFVESVPLMTAVRRDALLPTFDAALTFAAAQCERVLLRYPDYTPMYTVDGLWNREGERWTHWCEGFYPGIFWLLHKHTGAASWRRRGGTLQPPAGTTLPRPHGSRSRLSLLLNVFTLVSPDRGRRAETGTYRRGPDAGAATAEGRLSGVVRRTAVALHRHHDERRPCPLGRERDGRRFLASNRAGTLPHDGEVSDTSRRRHSA